MAQLQSKADMKLTKFNHLVIHHHQVRFPCNDQKTNKQTKNQQPWSCYLNYYLPKELARLET